MVDAKVDAMARNASAMSACPTEADWHDAWTDIQIQAGSDNGNLAVLGGARADRFAWVFMSGYQAAVRSCFPEFAGHGWSCFAAAEPSDGPGCVLAASADGFLLNGEKSWIAGALHIERLVVAVGDVNQRRFLSVECDAEGVTISVPRTPTFLAEMSQGTAHFQGVRIDPERVIEGLERARLFRVAEPLFVLLALNGCLAAHAQLASNGTSVLDSAAAALDFGLELPPQLADRAAIRAGLSELRVLTTAVVDQFVTDVLPSCDNALGHSWVVDGRLLEMFGILDDKS